jgi:hypothetical protein
VTENPPFATTPPAASPARCFDRRVIEVEEATRIAEELGLRRAGAAKRRRKNGRSCEDCYFHRRLLCALDLDEPCSTFRADGPQGLVPPRQPALLMRDAAEAGLAAR